MKVLVQVLDAQQWKALAANAHLVVFNEGWDPELEKIDFALLMTNEKNEMISYATAQEYEVGSVYLQYGGAFPTFKGTPIVYKSFQTMIELLLKKYKTITTLVQNTNLPMLKFYMKQDFLITGVRFFGEHTFLENSYDRGH